MREMRGRASAGAEGCREGRGNDNDRGREATTEVTESTEGEGSLCPFGSDVALQVPSSSISSSFTRTWSCVLTPMVDARTT